jgi:hypothetical protein
MDMIPVGAAGGCDLLILSFLKKSKDRSLRQLLQGRAGYMSGKYAVRLAQALKKA